MWPSSSRPRTPDLSQHLLAIRKPRSVACHTVPGAGQAWEGERAPGAGTGLAKAPRQDQTG